MSGKQGLISGNYGMQIETIRRNINFMSLEGWYTIAQIFGVSVLAITVVVGAVTVYLGWRVNKAQKADIRQKDERLARDLKDKDIQIAAANAGAAKANEQAQNAIAAAAGARAETAQAIKEQERLRNQNLELSLQVEKERVARLQLEERVAPRSLDKEKRTALVKALSADPHHRVVIASLMVDPESANYGDLLEGVLKEANWDVTHVKDSLNDFKGISLFCVTTYERPLPGYQTLLLAIQGAGMNLQTVPVCPKSIGADLPEGTLLILVGRK